MKKRLLAGLLTICLVVGLLPVSAMAADPALQPSDNSDPQSNVEQTSVQVEYSNTDRSTATITYHKEGIEANPFNLIFLVDTSKQGAASHAAFEQMMNDNGTSYIYDYDAASTVQLITYQNTASNTGIMGTKESFMSEFGSHGVSGEGTANEPRALDAAIEAVQAAHSENSYPTVVFWVLGEQFGETDTTKIAAKLQELDGALTDGTDALVTWQYAAQPNELLTQYATQHTEAHDDSGQQSPAAHAASDAVLLQEEMAADLEEIVHDHYHNISFSLELDSSQTLVKRITGARYEAGSAMASLTATLREDGKGIDVHIERQCRQIELDFILEVELDTSVYEQQTVIPEGKIIADHNGDNGGLHSGLFDEKIEYGLELDLPAVQMDRTAHDITFQNADGVSDITNKLTGESITLPMGEELSQDGSSFGGWNVVAGANIGYHYAPGEIISMPAGDMTLEPAFGHVEVDLEIDYEQGEEPSYGNQMKQFDFTWQQPFIFNNVKIPNGSGTIAYDSIVSIQVIDFLPEYNTVNDPQDALRVELTNVDSAVYARWIGATENDKVVAYLVPSKLQSGKYDLYIAGPGGVKAPKDCSRMFGRNELVWTRNITTISLAALDISDVTTMTRMFDECSNLTSLIFGEKWDTSNVTDMASMFVYCSSLTSLDLSNWDTSNVTNMNSVFWGCSSLVNIEFGDNWNTSNVTSMGSMFYNCSSLTSLNLESWDISQVTTIASMFSGCSKLESVTFGGDQPSSKVTNMSGLFSDCSNLANIVFGDNWDTSSVKNMSKMFFMCTSLTSLNVSKFNTSSVTDMSQMFYRCSRLKKLDLSSFDTSNVTNMSQMFERSSGIEYITFGDHWDTSKVENMGNMFYDCSGLKELDLSNFDTSQAIYMYSMFYNCSILTELHLDSFDTSSARSLENMFYRCSGLTELDVSNFDTSSVISFQYMFYGCDKLGNIIFGEKWDTSKVNSMGYMFSYCSSLTELDLSQFDTSSVTYLSHMFSYCSSLTELDLSKFDISNVSDISNMFSGCVNLESVTIGLGKTNAVSSFSSLFYSLKSLKSVTFITPADGAEFPNLSTMQNMFYNCSSLETVDLGNWKLPNLTNTRWMFYGCAALTDIDLSWSGIRSTADAFNVGNMFTSITAAATLEIGNDASEHTAEIMAKIADAFPGSVTSGGAPFTQNIALNEPLEVPNEIEETPQTPNETPGDVQQTPDETPGDVQQTPNETPGDVQQTPDETPGDVQQTPDETPGDVQQTPDETPGDVQQTPNETPGDVQQTPDETPGDVQQTPDETPGDVQQTPDETPGDVQQTPDETLGDSQSTSDEAPQAPNVTDDGLEEGNQPEGTEVNEPSDEMEEPAEEPSDVTLGTAKTALSRSFTTYANGDESVYIHPEMVSAYDTITYKVTVKYVGDAGVKSGRITLNFPIPEDIQQFQGTAENSYKDAGWYVSTTQIDYSGAPTGYKGGRVVEEPEVVTLSDDSYALQGVFEGLYTGTEVTVSIKTTVQAKQDDDYTDGYAFWDGTAYVTDSAGTSASQTVRLWNLKNGGGDATPPTPSAYQLSYAFTGDVPSDAELPQTTVVNSGTQVTTAGAPSTNLNGYTFDGWYRSDTGEKVSPNNSFNMPAGNLILTGKWKLDEQYVQKITVKYEYTDNNDGAHIPAGAPALPAEQTVKIGQTHYIQKIDQDASYHKFGGWEPTLSVNGQTVVLIKQSDGTYQDSAKTYTIDIASGTLSTDQFRGKTDVVVTFGGAWTPYKGTIHFDANGGEGTMNDMANVTWDTTTTLSKNIFTYPVSGYQFIGWAKTPSGSVAKADEATADQLIDQDGETVTLYAVWKRSDYGVGYDLSHVTSSNMGTTVTLGGSYSTTLTADTGYDMSDVSITMGGVVITSQVYDETTGQVTINNINGNIIIKAEATQSSDSSVTNKYPIHMDSTGSGTASSDKTEAAEGEQVTITTNGTVDKITVTDKDGNDIPLTDNGDGSYTFEMPDAEVTVTVEFDQGSDGDSDGEDSDSTVTNKYPIHVDSAGSGTASSDKTEAAAGEDVTITTNGTVDKIIVTDKDGNDIPLTDNGDGSYTFEMPDAEVTVTVEFDQNSGGGGGGGTVTDKYPVHVDSTGSGTASSDKTEAAAGENITITTDGTVDKIIVTDKDGNDIPLTDNGDGTYTFEMPKSEVTVSVEFEPVVPDVADPDATGVSGWLNTVDHRAYLSGYGNGEFRPDNDMTRAEVAQMFYNLLLDQNVPITVSFSDVTEDAWYAKAVNTLASLGIVLGVGEDRFDPERSITRAEFTVIAMRFTNSDMQGENIFSDVSANDWFYHQIIGSIQYGWINGYSDGTFRPNKTITRAEVTTIVNRMLGRCADEDFVNEHQTELTQFDDVSLSHWAYYNIAEATNAHDYSKDEKKESWMNLNRI